MQKIGAQVPPELADAVDEWFRTRGLKRGAKQQLSTVAYLLAFQLPEPVLLKMMGWVASKEAEGTLSDLTKPGASWKKLREIMPGEGTHFIDRILDPDAQKGDPPDAKVKPSGGRPSGRRAS